MNLLVGKNNSGKTSVLEAINLLTENGSLPALARSAIQRRQQKFWFTDNQRNIDIFDISPVFFPPVKRSGVRHHAQLRLSQRVGVAHGE